MGAGLSRCSKGAVFHQDLQGKGLDVQILFQNDRRRYARLKVETGQCIKICGQTKGGKKRACGQQGPEKPCGCLELGNEVTKPAIAGTKSLSGGQDA